MTFTGYCVIYDRIFRDNPFLTWNKHTFQKSSFRLVWIWIHFVSQNNQYFIHSHSIFYCISFFLSFPSPHSLFYFSNSSVCWSFLNNEVFCILFHLILRIQQLQHVHWYPLVPRLLFKCQLYSSFDKWNHFSGYSDSWLDYDRVLRTSMPPTAHELIIFLVVPILPGIR